MPSIITRLQHGWNAFMGRDPTPSRNSYESFGYGSYFRPDRSRILSLSGGDRSIVASVICRIAIDAAQIDVKHVKIDKNNGRYVDTVYSALNRALSRSANIDQTGRAFIQDAVQSLCEDGCIAIVPTDTSTNPYTGAFDVETLRVGKVVQWFPKHVKVDLYNENTGKREQLILPKSFVAIVQNPLYEVMNEPNSTLQRLKHTLANLDVFNERNASGKLDLIIQLPYVVKTETRREQAEKRRKEIEMQLTGSKYGIAYTDGTERITQLNRPVENTYWNQAKELMSMLYNQLGLTQSVFDGTADEKTMNNYYSRTIEPILSAITEEMERKFLTKTAITQGHAIRFFRDSFKLVTIEQLSTITTNFKQAEVVTSNEIRAIIGWKPSVDPKADELRNSNISQPNDGMDPSLMDPYAMPEDEFADEEQPVEEGLETELPPEEEANEDDVPFFKKKFSELDTG